MGELIEVELKDGVLSFDGRVVEGFGFSRHEARRVHISKVSEVKFDAPGKRFLLQVKASTTGRIDAQGKPDAATFAEVEAFVEAVRAAAPNLKS
jgi:hypothetical protein